ncbi:LLM class flavin-dependent oxidoreductase [Pseudohalocynthiibacter aestuariivivens]|jgi:flavin-dependent trigonelline monooxygenase, oxygenase component|uniref:LLM class flavin-dependent oxidoreductase n=1 Tax=Pseudohalocynthiibacter aestuariivivens TaxID=1591409 RepID=A0ABV5JA71_9RHOB|nr:MULTISPECIES: LLM class flavin-dependent oxidoreductase [Pseudohalocynthiibacter]MBS9716918.1 LLM class flavin-dependent oxidoreductase [Pseudohalocynthiibacter aestuariivivens]MCK0101988.1 LLM class flavin-dependent oxidoreductase [Pseudohalocynthiibacter sp. F2068]
MKFQLAINMERIDDSLDMTDVQQHTLEMVKMADKGGFNIVWAAEHHSMEMTIAPNPFQILTWWGEHTKKIRLGTAVAVAPYWTPIRLAGEAAMTDLISGGRLEFGIGSGAYQREFDRMHPGLKQSDAWRYMHEMLPAVLALWQGDYAHDGEFWSFPKATSVPKPLQQPHPPIWVAARAPITFDYAVKHGYNIMSWPLTRPMSEVDLYLQRLDEAMEANPGAKRPIIAMMRHTAVYDKPSDRGVPIAAARRQLSQFENLFKNLDDVVNGFAKQIPLESLENRDEYDPDMLAQNLMFGTPEEVIAKLKQYEERGVDEFIYYASMGLGLAEQKHSLELFCDEVIPAFA